jgi:hypothetical protein
MSEFSYKNFEKSKFYTKKRQKITKNERKIAKKLKNRGVKIEMNINSIVFYIIYGVFLQKRQRV